MGFSFIGRNNPLSEGWAEEWLGSNRSENVASHSQSVKMDAIKKSHSSSEFSIMKSYLFRGRFTDRSQSSA